MFTQITPALGRAMFDDRQRAAAQLRLRLAQHRMQRERVRSSLILRPGPR